jgi:C-terminal processing protease CtpA/Prc
MSRSFKPISLLAVVVLSLAACQLGTLIPTATTEPQATTSPLALPAANEPYQIVGSFDYSNSIVTDYYVEHAVALVDMYGFVTRDLEWEIPLSSQTLGFLAMDKENQRGEYTLQLPAKPTGTIVDVAQDGKTGSGVQVFAVAYWPNLTGGPYSEGDDPSHGWPSYLASVKTDTESNEEVIGGKLVVWAPDDNQSFPTGFGEDGKLFTADDPVAPIQAGYSIVDLDQKPFTFTKEAEPNLTLYEPQDVAIKDYSNLSYTEAFDKMVEFVRTNYAFNGIQGKQPNWDTLYNEIKPRVQQAEQTSDASAYYLALRDFTWAFKDGHVGLSGGDIQDQLFSADIAGGYGFAIRELDDGRVVVVFLTDGGPAAQAGMQIGAEVNEFNGKPIKDAIAEVKPWALPSSTDWAIRYQQARYLLRAVPGTEATVAFTNPGGTSQTVTLTSIVELDSFRRTSVYYGVDTNPMLPVEFKILDSGVGYLLINSNYDDLNLIIRLFQRALETFQANEVLGIIIDLRYNSGGAPLGLAGFLTDQEIPMGQMEYYSEKTGKFEPEGVRDKILPNVEQYSFDKMVLLVGPACYSACDEESYGFSQVPGMIVVGMYPTASTFAEVARGQIMLPEGFSLQIPTGRSTLPDGSLFLEGSGVQPTVKVPITLENVTSTEDVVLQFGERAVLQPLGAGITPSAPPKLMTPDETQSAVQSSTKLLDEKAREQYSAEDLLKMDATFPYTITLSKSTPLIWAWGWCAKDQATLNDNLGKMKATFELNGQDIGMDSFLKLDYDSSDGQKCRAYLLGLTDWQGGENHAVTTVTITAALKDGKYDFLPGYQIFDYAVYVKP